MAPLRSAGSDGARPVRIRRWQAGEGAKLVRDEIACEEPLELRVDTRSLAVVMRTPGHDDELAAGFLVSEGLIQRSDQIAELRADSRNPAGNVMQVFLRPEVTVDQDDRNTRQP